MKIYGLSVYEKQADLERENELAADIASQMVNTNNAPVQGRLFPNYFFHSIVDLIEFALISVADPCEKIHCGAGKICQVAGTTASCVCIPECAHQSDPRRMVCTNRNETWNSDCEVYRERCLCDTSDERCKSHDLKHIHINYYGECKEMPVNREFIFLFRL